MCCGIPPGRVSQIQTEIEREPLDRRLKEIIAKDGGDVVGSTPEELGSHLRGEVTRYAKVIKAGNIKAD